MLNYIWVSMLTIALGFALISGNSQALSSAVLSGAESSIQLIITVSGTLCFWSGMMRIAEKSSITAFLAKVFSPVLRKLFKNSSHNSSAMKYISMNISANLLGLGNAATPFGLSAMKELQKANDNPLAASDDMLMFVVLNTASLQLIPTTLFSYRTAYGSTDVFSILPCIWIASIAALTVGITVAKSLSPIGRSRR